MAYSAISGDSTVLHLGDNLKVTVGLQVVPFVAPTKADLISKLNESGDWVVQDIQEPWSFSNERVIEVYGVMVIAQSVGELKAKVVNAINFWNTYSIQVQKVEIEVGFRPGDLVPSTGMTLALVSIAAIVVVGYVALKGVVK